jgi:multisubunit Na+/H+ antiporter MnhE subunit
MLANTITMTPGTLTLEVDRTPTTSTSTRSTSTLREEFRRRDRAGGRYLLGAMR